MADIQQLTIDQLEKALEIYTEIQKLNNKLCNGSYMTEPVIVNSAKIQEAIDAYSSELTRKKSDAS